MNRMSNRPAPNHLAYNEPVVVSRHHSYEETHMLRTLLTIAFLFSACLLSAAEPLAVGSSAPAFELTGSDGKTYKLADFAGKQAVVIAWYPRAFTGGCTKECQSFKADGGKLRAFNVAYFTASCDPVEKNTEFAKSLDLDYPILSDPEGSVAKAFGIYNPDRRAAARVTFIIGTDGKILSVESKVNTPSHGADIAARLAELGVAKKE
jgi:peroxiredoxin Q/BCP